MQPFFPLFIMTFIHLVIPSVYTRPSVCKMTYCCNYQRKGRDTMKAIAKSRKMLVAEFLRKENSHELPRKNGQIKGRETFAMTDTMQTIHRKLCFEFSDTKTPFTALSIQFQAKRHVCQRLVKMFMKAIASKVLPKFI